MTDTAPHITIGHHPVHGIVATNNHGLAVAEHVLARVGFQPLPNTRLFALAEPDRDPARRARQAVASLRSARYTVACDMAYEPELKPTTQPSERNELRVARQHPDEHRRPTTNTPAAPAPSRAGWFASAIALDEDIVSGRITIREQLRDADGTLRALGTDTRTGEGVLLYGEGGTRYIESRLPDTDRATADFARIRGNGHPEPFPSERRAQAARTRSPQARGPLTANRRGAPIVPAPRLQPAPGRSR